MTRTTLSHLFPFSCSNKPLPNITPEISSLVYSLQGLLNALEIYYEVLCSALDFLCCLAPHYLCSFFLLSSFQLPSAPIPIHYPTLPEDTTHPPLQTFIVEFPQPAVLLFIICQNPTQSAGHSSHVPHHLNSHQN